MLAGCLLVALVALPMSSVLLFTPFARRAQGGLASVAIAGLIAGVAACVAIGLGAVTVFALAGAAILVAASGMWAPVTPRWSGSGRAAWGAAILAGLLYLAYMLEWTFRSRLGPVGTIGGLMLWALEAASYLLGLAYLWEMVDVLATTRWRRRIADPMPATDDEALPFVSLHVPAHNEPPEMVIETLQSLLALDYPRDRLQIVMIDDNTSDTALWHPVAEFCTQHHDRITFHHLEDWPGFKSGALNFALTVTDPAAEVIGVIDADYLVDADYLRRCAPLFTAEPRLGFVQTPQDYRDWEQAAYYRRLYYSYSYFFAVSQASRNERDGAIFGGTMGLIRRDALTQVGGWDEWCITEDAELSLRLLRAGWSGRHIDRSFGRGIMPLTFDALKRQRFRWCFGGIQILRMHWRSLLPWTRAADNQLTVAQRLSYLSGAVQWYGDLLALAFTAFLLVAALDLGLGGGLVFRRLSGFLLAAVPALILLNLTRALALLRRATAASWRDAIGAFGIWLALGWTVATASVRGAVAPAGVFLRTPKTRGSASWSDAFRANRAETVIAALVGAGIVTVTASVHGPGRWLLAGLLLLPVAGAVAAPVNTVAALRAELPDELRRRRRTERLRAWATGPLRPARVLTAVAALAGAAAAAFVVLAPGVQPAAAPDLLHEAQGHGPAVLPPGPNGALPAPHTTPVANSTPQPGATASTAAGGSADGGGSASPAASPVTQRSAAASPTPTVAPSATTTTTARPTPTTTPTPTTKPTPTSKPTPTTSPKPTPTSTPTRRPTAQPTGSP